MTQAIQKALSRRERRAAKKKQTDQPPIPQATLASIKPITINQSKVFKLWSTGQHLLIHGYAGTGKSFLALYLGLRDVEGKVFKRMVIVRSAVPSRNQGFLPGNDKEKAAIYELPYAAIVDHLYGKAGSYNRLKENKTIDFTTTSYLRGLTIDDSVIVLDEVQNMTDAEVNTVMTRVGQGSRVIILGDFRQTDLNTKVERSCIQKLMDTVSRINSFSSIEMSPNDIVRSGLVKEWILARN
jgi:phosphate starvation-inducible protein PhoH